MVDIVCLGEILLDMFPAELGRKLADVSAFQPKPGGAPANVAVAAARLGKSSAFIGKVGDDAFGHSLAQVLKDQGVDTRGVRFDPDARTTLAFIAKPDENTSEYVFYRNPGADLMLRPDELERSLLEGTRALHFGSLSLTGEPIRSATYQAVKLAADAGALISFDVNYRPNLWSSPAEALKQIRTMLPNANLLKVNEIELELLAGHSHLETACAALIAGGPELVVVTLGAQGSYFYCARGHGMLPAFKVQALDATGCGDAFIAGLLSQLVEGENWRSNVYPDQLMEILRYANAVGALTATQVGVIPALPNARQVAAFLAGQFPSPLGEG
jgi:fructokinase